MSSILSPMNVLVGATALLAAGSITTPDRDHSGPVLKAAASFVSPKTIAPAAAPKTAPSGEIASVTSAALAAFSGAVRPLSRPNALENAFRSYFAFKAARPNEVRKPYLYFVDYGLPSTEKRGYVFDMTSLKIVDGPFTVAAGGGSRANQAGIPTLFSNASGSNATSLGLYVAKSIYDFSGHSGGRTYSSVGMRLMGVSHGFNDNAFARGVVAHGAPYVTSSKAGRSQGCPAMEPDRAARLLPKLADGGMVFLFAPDQKWLSNDQWVSANAA